MNDVLGRVLTLFFMTKFPTFETHNYKTKPRMDQLTAREDSLMQLLKRTNEMLGMVLLARTDTDMETSIQPALEDFKRFQICVDFFITVQNK